MPVNSGDNNKKESLKKVYIYQAKVGFFEGIFLDSVFKVKERNLDIQKRF